MAEALGRTPVSSRFSPDISKHFAFGTDKTLKAVNVEQKDKL
jgi:betaine-homocysteine S-methyltransferase